MASMTARSLTKIEPRRTGVLLFSVILTSDEQVARAAHRADYTRPLRVVAQLLTQPADQHIDRTVVRLPIDASSLIKDFVATLHSSPIPDQPTQQFELCRR